MPKKISLAQGRRWLERFDDGETEAQIARRESRDPRTVKKAISEARNERDMSTIRRETLRDAFRHHQDDLLRTLDLLGDLARLPAPTDLKLKHPGATQSSEWSLNDCVIERSESGDVTVTWDNESALMFALLQEHLPGEGVWKQFLSHKRILGQITRAHLDLSDEVKRVLEDATGLEIGLARSDTDHVTTEGAHLIYRLATQQALGDPEGLSTAQAALSTSDDPTTVQMDEGGVTWTLGKGTCLVDLKQAMDQISKSREISDMKNRYQHFEESSQALGDSIGLIRAGWFVPGQCQVCRRMSL